MKHEKLSIGLIGSGNVALHLSKILKDKGHKITIISRNLRTGKELASAIDAEFSLPKNVDFSVFDLVLVAIKDSEIIKFIEKLPKDLFIAYTSGSIQLDSISHPNLGVFYPLQTFSKDSQIDFSGVPFLIEAKNEELSNKLMRLAASISDKVYELDSEKRFHIHIAAIFVNNFSNYMFNLAHEHLSKNNLPFELMHALMDETIAKAKIIEPVHAQTGPARRADQNVLNKHLAELDSEAKLVYEMISNLITAKYSTK